MEYIAKPLKDLAKWATHHDTKCVYEFGEGGPDDTKLLGVKGVALCEMTRMKVSFYIDLGNCLIILLI